MFESTRPDRRRPPRLIVVLSIAAHAAALVALVATAMWQVDKLGVDDAPLLMASAPGAPLPSAGDEAPEPEEPKKEKARPARDLTQIDRSTAKPDEANGGGGGDEDGDRDGKPGDDIGTSLFPCGEGGSCSVLDQAAPACGNGAVEGSEECDDGNRVAGDGCGAACKTEKELIVPPRLIEGKRISGNPQIAAPDSVKQRLVRSGIAKLTANVKMCLDRAGRVRSLAVLKSTGFIEYDKRLLAGMRTWVYEPYKLSSGVSVPVCTVVTFIYRVQ